MSRTAGPQTDREAGTWWSVVHLGPAGAGVRFLGWAAGVSNPAPWD